MRARSFGQVAELYDKRRPGYPSQLFDDLIASPAGSRAQRALEAGAGTGRATLELARRGVHVTAIEHDAEMAAVARRAARVAALPVEVLVQTFEAWDGEPSSFDLVVCAQAWHWIDHGRGVAVAHTALRPGGVLALVWNLVTERHGPVHAAVDAVYAEHAPELLKTSTLTGRVTQRIDPSTLAVDGFEPPQVLEYLWEWRIDAAAYAELIATHSDHILLGPEKLDALTTAVRAAIEQSGAGEIVIPYRTDLVMARRDAG